MGTIVLLITTFAVIIMRTIFGKHSTIITTLVKNALPIGFFLGFFALAGSLTYSEIYGLTPCLFCWWQRIFIYPLAILFGIAWYRSSKFSEEINNFKLGGFNKFNISSEISESSDYILFVRNQQDDEKSKTLEEAWKEGKRATDKLLQLLKVKIIDGNPAVTAEPIYQNSEH